MESTPFLGPPRPRSQELRRIIKIIAYGGMIGTAILYPLANAGGLLFRSLTLSIFILSGLGFHALHPEPFIRFGPFTAAAALALLLVAVLANPAGRTNLIPWLPLFIALVSLITIVINDISRRDRVRTPSFRVEDEFSWPSTDAWSNHSLRTMSTPQQPPSVFESNRHDHLLFAGDGPPSLASQRTGTTVSDITLSSVPPQIRSGWDARTRVFFPEAALPEEQVDPGPNSDSNSDSEGWDGGV
ncbi:hypothetical protein C7999DRAFT_27655 [Corynascus novoguineensis]|uniref:Uncharacterized protein n=1 Tax=Corynascus novoguineensis TaxID=1126955 RepID=A0AAN7D4B6_9PEZI|nr:hypothetical protein C7999DRAFT_27655 [Corynascus novoguineensis]